MPDGGDTWSQFVAATVTRQGMAAWQHGASAIAEIRVLADEDPTVGIASYAAIDKGLDEFKVAERRGATPAFRHVLKFVDDGDPDFIVVVVQ